MEYKSILLLVFLLLLQNETTLAKQPNIVMVVLDDWGWNDVGYHNSKMDTPIMDKLAEEGVRLENYYVQPVCTPTRAALLTGRYPIRYGLQSQFPILVNQDVHLPTSENELLSIQLKRNNYKTHLVGKWHLGFDSWEVTPTERGFDSFFGFYNGGEDHYSHVIQRFLDLRLNKTAARQFNGNYSTSIYASKSIEIIGNHNTADPLFLLNTMQAPHTPLQVPEIYTKSKKCSQYTKQRQLYCGMVLAVDEAVGEIVEALKAKNMWQNTLFIVSTDNGGMPPGGNNYPLRGTKGTLFEGGVKGVAFATGPLLPSTVRGNTYDGLMHISDWLPTLLLGLLDLPSIPNNDTYLPLDGFNQWSAITSNNVDPPRTELLHNIINNNNDSSSWLMGIRVGDWKLLENAILVNYTTSDDIAQNNNVYNDSEETTNIDNPTTPPFLYNLKVDPNEHFNLANKEPEMLEKLRVRLAYYQRLAVPIQSKTPDLRANAAARQNNAWTPWLDSSTS